MISEMKPLVSTRTWQRRSSAVAMIGPWSHCPMSRSMYGRMISLRMAGPPVRFAVGDVSAQSARRLSGRSGGGHLVADGSAGDGPQHAPPLQGPDVGHGFGHGHAAHEPLDPVPG